MINPFRVVVALLLVAEATVGRGSEPLPAEASDYVTVESEDSKAPESPPDKSKPCFTLKLRGRVDTDFIGAQQTAANVATFGELQDVIGLRRARIGVEGDCGDCRRYVAEIDLATGEVVPRDVYFAFGDREEAGEWQSGHFREPFSLEGGTSARYFAFMERSPINLLDPARNWGLGLYRENKEANYAFSLGVFRAGSGPSDLEAGEGNTVGLTTRWTTAIVNEGDGERLLHLGFALSERVPETGVIVINQKPRSSLLEFEDSSTSSFVPRVSIPACFQQLVNLQIAAADGSLWGQAEWYGSWIDPTNADCIFLHGFHLDGGYFLTGEHRQYDSANGTLGAVKVRRPCCRRPHNAECETGWGAWELTARYTYLDFFDLDQVPAPNGGPTGIRLPQSTFGVNWYLTDQTRLMFNYTCAAPREINTGTSVANLFAARLAVFW